MQPQWLSDMRADRHQRIERGHGPLKDHRHAIAPDRRHLASAEPCEVAALEADGVARHPARFLQETHDGQCRHALAAMVLVLGVNLLGNGLRETLDLRQAERR
jgi:hypothetical protein